MLSVLIRAIISFESVQEKEICRTKKEEKKNSEQRFVGWYQYRSTT